jgi:hypothetical protein
MSLATAIAAAIDRNERVLAQRIATPTLPLDSEAQIRLQHFADYCKAVGVRPLPAAPATCAAFAKAQYTRGASADAILATLQDIEALHSNANLANPVASTAVRAVLEEILHIDGPRSWSKSERLLFASLPIEIRAIIERRVKMDSNAVRKAQHERAAAVQELEQLKQKGIKTMAPPTKKELKKGAYGYGDDPESYSFLQPENPRGSWDASASGEGYNARWDDDRGYERGTGAYTDSDSGLVNRLPDELRDSVNDGLRTLPDDDEGMGSGSKLLGGGGPLTKGRGVGNSPPRYRPKTGPRTNARD